MMPPPAPRRLPAGAGLRQAISSYQPNGTPQGDPGMLPGQGHPMGGPSGFPITPGTQGLPQQAILNAFRGR